MRKVWGGVLATLGLAALAGGMLFFAAIMAPLVFLDLPMAIAGPLIRTAFPWYYGYCVAGAAIAALGFLLRKEYVSALLPIAIIGVTLWLWQCQLPALDSLRAAHDNAAFERGHQLAVWLNGAELLGATMLLVRVGAWLR